MAPQKNSPDPYEHEFAIRSLTAAVKTLTDQVEANSNAARQNREEILVIKTKWATMAVVAGAIAGVVVKLIPFHS